MVAVSKFLASPSMARCSFENFFLKIGFSLMILHVSDANSFYLASILPLNTVKTVKQVELLFLF